MFADFLDALALEIEDELGGPHRVSETVALALDTGKSQWGVSASVPVASVWRYYDEISCEMPWTSSAPPLRQPPPPPQMPVSRRSVRDELGLRSGMSVAEIKEARRAFAWANHPDRVQAIDAEEAARRMQEANVLVDAALKKARRR